MISGCERKWYELGIVVKWLCYIKEKIIVLCLSRVKVVCWKVIVYKVGNVCWFKFGGLRK